MDSKTNTLKSNGPIPTQPPMFLVNQHQIPAGEIKQRHMAATSRIAVGDLYYGDGNNNFIRLPAGTEGQVLTMVDGIPTWV